MHTSTLDIRTNSDGSSVASETNSPGDHVFIAAADVTNSPSLFRHGRFILVTTDNPRLYQIVNVELNLESAVYECVRVRG